MAVTRREDSTYLNLPHKGQLLMILICRLTEPVLYSSISPYLYYMVRDFGYKNPSTISELSTVVVTSFALGQTLTAMFWGRFSDKYGRKPALMLGSLGTLSMTLLFGLSTNIYMAALSRFACGLLNGNVGVMRTMVAEIMHGKKVHQTRAFALLPMARNIGTILGPIIGGLLANPSEQYPSLFGSSKLFQKFPYLLPNLVPIPLALFAVFMVSLFIKETGESRHLLLDVRTDPFLRLGRALKTKVFRMNDDGEEEASESEPLLNDTESSSSQPQAPPQEETDTSLGKVLTKAVKTTLICNVLLTLHAPAFLQLFSLFLATPRIDQHVRNTFVFNGGLGLPTSTIGLISSIMAVIGIVVQVAIYPTIANRFGNARVHQLALYGFPVGYSIIPYLSFLPEAETVISVAASAAVSGVWVISRSFAVPPMTVLMTNAAHSKKVMGTVHGINQAATSAARTLGPFILGNLYSLGVKVGVIGLAWWVMTFVVIIEILFASQLKEWGEE
ncbi:hypothetical protein TRICI_003068 [Trichomonascus ciferrii]|uniref:Major facilitator superfamily (MFS) profile domain-containing protein n=1 Tax=Trichomonascus ciferrii TaxID=44093 RepID=A0A642V632_9ASCO|nr:hypothetical protein TRICI_003068 [Trichomonascus ciferrii]